MLLRSPMPHSKKVVSKQSWGCHRHGMIAVDLCLDERTSLSWLPPSPAPCPPSPAPSTPSSSDVLPPSSPAPSDELPPTPTDAKLAHFVSTFPPDASCVPLPFFRPVPFLISALPLLAFPLQTSFVSPASQHPCASFPLQLWPAAAPCAAPGHAVASAWYPSAIALQLPACGASPPPSVPSARLLSEQRAAFLSSHSPPAGIAAPLTPLASQPCQPAQAPQGACLPAWKAPHPDQDCLEAT
mmetsp:Transcript_60721/g.111069  ORF Transcript_60721/g.111069 Transcript_60721/m.111069 type:complete len:241 (+) Transcript_60721:601-1323(+)